MKNALDLYRRLIAIRIRGQMLDRSSFLLEVFATLVGNVVAILTLGLVLQRFGSIAGWTFRELALLYGMVETAFGLMDMIFSGFDPAHFGTMVRMGAFDQLLLRPANIILQVLGSEFILRRIGRIGQGLVVLIAAMILNDIAWTPFNILFLLLTIASQVLFFGGLFILGAGITFFTLESIEFINIFTYGGVELMSYPMNIYQDWMRRFFTFILPAIFLNYYPALYLLAKPDPLNFPAFAPFLAPIAGVLVLLGGLAFWNFGIQHYQSSGT